MREHSDTREVLSSMKILVTGASGQLGYDCVRDLTRRGHQVRGVSSRELPLTEPDKVREYIEAYHPQAVVHCAAYTAVDKAEDEPELARAVNAAGTQAVAEACAAVGAKMIYISTDYVFPGDGDTAYEPDAPKGPLNVYGQTKLDGELAVQRALDHYFIVRISWVFGRNGNNFIRTMLRLSETHDELTVVDDQVGSPTYTYDLARLLGDMAESDSYGVYQATNEGFCSWAEFAAEIFRQAGRATHVTPVPSSAYPTKARRPHNSRMSKACLDQAGFQRLPRWQDAVGRYLTELGVSMADSCMR